MENNGNKKKNCRSAGRKPKFTTEELLKIIDKYKASGMMCKKTSASAIAKFGVEKLGIEGLRYAHFTGNKEVNDMLEEYKNSFSTFTGYFSQKNVDSLSNLNVQEFVKVNKNNEQRMILQLEAYKKNFELTYNELLSAEENLNKAESEICVTKEENEKLNEDYKVMKKENKDSKDHIKRLEGIIKELGEGMLLDALKSTELVMDKEEDEELSVDIKKLNKENGGDLDEFFAENSILFD